MIIHSDNREMASFVRALFLDPSAYDSFEYFFKSAAFTLKEVFTFVTNFSPILFNGIYFGVRGGMKAKRIFSGIFNAFDLCQGALSAMAKINSSAG